MLLSGGLRPRTRRAGTRTPRSPGRDSPTWWRGVWAWWAHTQPRRSSTPSSPPGPRLRYGTYTEWQYVDRHFRGVVDPVPSDPELLAWWVLIWNNRLYPIFSFRFFFHESSSPKPLEIKLGSLFFENSRRCSQVKVPHRYQGPSELCDHHLPV